MTQADIETGEIVETVTFEAGGERATMTGEQLRMAAQGFGRFEGVKERVVLSEAQPLGLIEDNKDMTVDLIRAGRTLAIAIDAPKRLSVHEADTLKAMLDRAVKAAKKVAEKLG